MPLWILELILYAIAFGVVGIFGAWQLGKWTGRRMLSVAKKGQKALPGVIPPTFRQDKAPKNAPGEDLLAYPQKLEGLERQMEERLELLGQQERVVEARGEELRAKGGRDELAVKYREDLELLRQRSLCPPIAAAESRHGQGLLTHMLGDLSSHRRKRNAIAVL